MSRAARGPRLAVAVVVAAVLTAGIGASPARAEDAEALIRQGIEQRRTGQDLRALELFRRAVEIEKTPRAVAQVALAEQALGLWVKAEQDMKAAFALPGDAWIKSHRKTLDSALIVIGDHLGTLQVWGAPADAEVRADDQVVGKLPDTGAVRVPVGPVTVSVRAAGQGPWSRVFDIKKADFVKEHVQLAPVSPAPSAIATVVSPAPRPSLALDAPRPEAQAGGVSEPVVDKPPSTEPEATDNPFYKKWWFWTIVGAVVAGGAVTAYALTRKGNSSCEPPNCWQ